MRRVPYKKKHESDSDSDSDSDSGSCHDVNEFLTEDEKRRRDELKDAPMEAKLKYLEKRWTEKGHSYIVEPREQETKYIDDGFDWYQKFALSVTRHYSKDNKRVEDTSLEINSPLLKTVLREVIGSYPRQSFLTTNISIAFPAECLYHYLPELKARLGQLREQDADGAAAKHLAILVDFTQEHFRDTIKSVDNLFQQGLVTYEGLWTLFKPGVLVYTTFYSQPVVYKLLSYFYSYGNCPSFTLDVQLVDFNGEEFGTRSRRLSIPQFEGMVSISQLPSFPLHLHVNEGAMKSRLIKRGRRWESHAGQQSKDYTGIALDEYANKYNVKSRIMIDESTYQRMNPNHAIRVNSFPEVIEQKQKILKAAPESELIPGSVQDKFASLTDEQCIMATPIVRGFSFSEKKFFQFFIDDVSDIVWNAQCFEQLVLPQSQKELVQALVTEHTERRSNPDVAAFEDIVKGKSGGLILVLHGPPGVGKTLTAECVAEYSKRPLYSVSSGDLTTSSKSLDEILGRTLDLASTWNAVLLIDEADVFLERRSLHDTNRNGLVSIFLRMLEYYSGILFMTTNRVRTFDDAFKSRIHVPLRYDSLTAGSRAQVWRSFLARAGADVLEGIGEAGCQELAQTNLNGRQIKNIVRTAKSLAAYKKTKLDIDQLKQVVDIQLMFEQELDDAEGDIDQVAR